MIVQPSDFNVANSRYLIPNILLGPGTYVSFIDEREAYILRVVFGSKFYKDFVDGLAALPALWLVTTAYVIGNEVSYNGSSWTAVANSLGVVPVEGAAWTKGDDNKWLKLRDGDVYTYSDKNYRYGGLKELLVPYIFSEYVKKNHVNVAKLGVNQAKTDNSVVVNPIHTICSAYNEFVRMLGRSYYGCQSTDTLYGFYWANREDYPDMRFDEYCEIAPINAFGI